MKSGVIAVILITLVASGCAQFKKAKESYNLVVSKDLTLEEQEKMLDKYVGRYAWTRGTIEDITEREVPGEPKKKVVPRDTKVEIFDMNFTYNGSVTVIDYGTYGGNIPKRTKVVVGLEIEPPLSMEKIDERLAEVFWFDDPTIRHVNYIRKWDKKTARAVMNHEVFIGMPSEAAVESWGIPTEVRTNEIGDRTDEQWAYREGQRTRYIYIIDGKVSKWEE